MVVSDTIDTANAQWAATMGELDVTPGDILARIERLAHIIETRQNARLRRRPGLVVSNRGDFDVLRTLRRAGPPYRMAPGEIAERTLVSSAGLSGRLKRLTDEGWITRVPSADDARSLLVELTADGRRDLDSDLPEHYRFEHSLLAELDHTDKEQLSQGLRKLLLALDESGPRQ